MRAKKTQENKKKRTFRWWNILVVGLALFFCVRLGLQIKEYHDLQEEAAYYEQVLAETEAAYQEQLDKQELLYNDSYLERMARERLGMVKEGETVISTVKTKIPETETDTDTDNAADKEEEDGQDKQDKVSSGDAAKE